jgi:uncharacterized protein YqeY
MASVFRMALRRATAMPAVAAPSAAFRSAAAAAAAASRALLRRPYSTAEEFVSPDEMSAATNEPPFVATLRQDLKAAMRARDQIRLDVVRGLITEVNNASKTALPIKTDIHLLRLMRRTRLRQADAAAEFMAAGRKDLAERELAQMGIIKQYEDATGIQTVSREEIGKIVTGVVADILSDQSHRDKLDIRTVIHNTEKELGGRDFLKSDLVWEANAQIKAKRGVW